jgi:hypothetical protein
MLAIMIMYNYILQAWWESHVTAGNQRERSRSRLGGK